MTDAERNLVIECLERRRKQLDTCPPVLPDQLRMIEDLIERFKAFKPAPKPAQPAKKQKPLPVATKSDGTPSVAEAQEQVERIVEMCEQVGQYDSSDAQEFAESVAEKAELILITIEERNHVTKNQADALDNMESGISRWIR